MPQPSWAVHLINLAGVRDAMFIDAAVVHGTSDRSSVLFNRKALHVKSNMEVQAYILDKLIDSASIGSSASAAANTSQAFQVIGGAYPTTEAFCCAACKIRTSAVMSTTGQTQQATFGVVASTDGTGSAVMAASTKTGYDPSTMQWVDIEVAETREDPIPGEDEYLQIMVRQMQQVLA
ncbi:hypothetical protein MRX96_026816 [Rhipicephalus microplus]